MLRLWLRALRPEHSVKNLLVFVPLALAVTNTDTATFRAAAVLFVAMSLLASATYIVNDILDLEADRAHPTKRTRPFAAGVLKPWHGLITAAALGLAAAYLALSALPSGAVAALAGYLVLTLAYSIYLKRLPFFDVIILAALFTLRLAAGSLLLPGDHPVSPWLMSFSMLFFTSLAMIKRYSELQNTAQAGKTFIDSRGYAELDLPLLLVSGVASGFGALTMFMVYLINEQYPRDQYANPQILWIMMPVLLVWLLRMWHLTVKGEMLEDPVLGALRDRASLALGGAIVVILAVAIG